MLCIIENIIMSFTTKAFMMIFNENVFIKWLYYNISTCHDMINNDDGIKNALTMLHIIKIKILIIKYIPLQVLII